MDEVSFGVLMRLRKISILLSLVLVTLSLLMYGQSSEKLLVFWQHRPIRNISHEIGSCYTAPLGVVWMSSHEKPSPAKVLENGVVLGPANSPHDEIRKKGNGRFSFWHNYIYFSASDNTSPISNGNPLH